jgi:hypothetical protein
VTWQNEATSTSPRFVQDIELFSGDLMPTDQMTVAAFLTPAEAEVVRARLDEEGIPSIILGDGTDAALPGVTDYEKGIRLNVAPENADRARGILELVRQEALADARATGLPLTPAGHPGWVCPQCQTVVEIESEVCPSCGRLMDLPEDQESAAARAIAAGEEVDAPEVKEELKTWVGDKIAHRAWRASVGGFLVAPFFAIVWGGVVYALLQVAALVFGTQAPPFVAWVIAGSGVIVVLPFVYAASLVWRIWSNHFALSAAGRTRATWATLVSFAVLALTFFAIPLAVEQPVFGLFLSLLVIGLGVMVLRGVRKAPGEGEASA